MKTNFFLILIILFALFLRFFAIGQMPFGFANDEVNYLFSAYHLWHTGQDLQGHFLPFSFQVDSSLSPVPVYLAAPFVGILGPSIASGRMVYGLIAAATIYLVYLLAKQLFERESVALLSAFVLSICPWYLLISRGAWDGVVALFFYVFGIYIFVRNSKKGNILWSLPVFLLGFYSYHATKVFFAALLIVFAIVYKDILWKQKKRSAIFFIGAVCIFLSFFLIISRYGVNRQDALIFKEASYVKNANDTVNFERKNSNASPLLKTMYNNKAWFFFYTMADQYLGAFSPQYLFTVGDMSKTAGWGTFMKGAFYIIEAPLLLIGLIGLTLQKKKREAGFLLALLLIAPLPSAVGMSKTYLIRAVMMLPFMSILIGWGIVQLIAYFSERKKLYGKIVMGLIILAYLFFFSRYSYQYISQFTPYGSEYWNGSSRTLAEYVGKNEMKYSTIVISGAPDMFLLDYGYMNGVDSRVIAKAWNDKWPATMGKVTFINNCPQQGKGDPKDFMAKNSLYISQGDCFMTSKAMMEIQDPQESLRVIWKIYEKN